MAIFLPASAEDTALSLDEIDPPRDRRRGLTSTLLASTPPSAPSPSPCATACAARSFPPELADDIMPKNIIMIGPTGVGKTEIARRLAKLTNSPFLKVEASKFTEVGYVGRDVESMIRDLVENAIDMVREEKLEEVEDKAELSAEDRLLDLLLPLPRPYPRPPSPPHPRMKLPEVP